MTLPNPNQQWGKINQPGQLAPHPSDKDNHTEHWMQTFQFDPNNVYISYN